MNLFNVKFLLTLFLVIAVSITVYQLQKPQDTRPKAQVLPSCSQLLYPCQEGSISFPQDEGVHPTDVEWWYANLNTISTSIGTQMAGVVALAKVKQSDGAVKGFALLEISGKSFNTFAYRISQGSITTDSGRQNVRFVSTDGQDLATVNFYQTATPFEYKVEATGTNIDVVFTLKSQKKPLVEGGTGFVPIFPSYPNILSGYYSLTQMSMNTDRAVRLPGAPAFTANGIGWIDHQWFNSPIPISSTLNPFSLKPNHEWFSIQLFNNVQIVAWEIWDSPTPSAQKLKNVDMIDQNGYQTKLTDVVIDPISYWTAPDGKIFANAWRIYKPGEFDLQKNTFIANQYVSTMGTYEGATEITGTYKGGLIKGSGYAEMTLGYRSDINTCKNNAEICDGLDNDCDLRIDEYCLSAPTNTPTPLPPTPTNTPVPPTPTLTPTPTSNPAPIGYIDTPGASTCNDIQGWTCDSSNYSMQLSVHIYRDGLSGGGGIYIGSTIANATNEPAVSGACGNTPNHRFHFSLPQSLYDGQPHSYYAYAINYPDTGLNPLLGNSPITLTCAVPTPTPLPPTPTRTPTPVPNPTNTPTPTPRLNATNTPAPTPTPTPKRLGDVDGNGSVDIFDFNEVVGFFGVNQTNPYLDADLDRSGEVDIFDFTEVISNFDK